MNKYCVLTLICILMHISATAQEMTGLYGKIISAEDKSPIEFADIYFKGTKLWCIPDTKGIFHLKAPAGTYTLVIRAVGYETFEEEVTLTGKNVAMRTFELKTDRHQLDEVVVVSNRSSHVRRSAFNAQDLNVKEMHNTSRSLGEALTQLPGLKLRESGGVGSDAQLSLDGFSGKHVKIFIDGVPQEGAGTALDINNLPINFAERIEVYKGVVPVGFGTDALGGVINIVTKKRRRGWSLDASYTYGSFNTHKSYVNFNQTFRNGLTYEINAFQNFSDNSYWIDSYITEFGDDGVSESTDRNKIYHVRRFNDQFHNEAAIGKIGVTGKSWADRLMVGFNYSHFYKEIQTGVYQYIVFGEKHRRGHSFVPSLEYSKRDLFVKGLDIRLNANYNHNITMNIDTSSYKYNWLGERKYTGSRGEQSYQDNTSKNTNWNVTATADYRLGKAHTVSSSFRRTTRSKVDGSSQLSDFSIPKLTRKNITGLSYMLSPSKRWSVTAFGKYYNQYNQGPVSQSSDGIGNYVNMSRTTNAFGYGAAGTYFIIKGLQVKLSYEKAYRLPTTDELFGDEDLEAGKTDLRPENSHNVNLNLSFPPVPQARRLHGGYIYLPRHQGLYPERAEHGQRHELRLLREPRAGKDSRLQHICTLQLFPLAQHRRHVQQHQRARQRALRGRQLHAGECDLRPAHAQPAIHVRQLRRHVLVARSWSRRQRADCHLRRLLPARLSPVLGTFRRPGLQERSP